MKISDYPATAYPNPSDSFVIDGAAGTKRITLDNLRYGVSGGLDPERRRRTNAKNTTFRGNSLGTSLTAAQLSNIRSGNFDNMWLGDFWEIGGHIWRIADFDYWWGTGDPASYARHIVIIPDAILYNTKWNANSSTVGGYLNSDIYRTGLQQAKTIINDAFNAGNLLSHFDNMVNSVTDGRLTGRIDVQTRVDLPNENMIWGGPMNKVMNNGNPTLWTQEVSNRQLSLFHVVPSLRSNGNYTYWLRDTVGVSTAATVNKKGYGDINDCNATHGVRPVFAIG